MLLSTRQTPDTRKDDNPAVAHFLRNGAIMSDQLGEDLPSETAHVWDSARRVREPVAWALLALTAITLLVSACQLFNLADATVPLVSSPVPVSAFALRASAVAPQFVAAGVVALPVLSVVLVAFGSRLTDHARQVLQTAAVVQAFAFVFGVISLAGAAGSHVRPGTWFILYGADVAIVATALIFTCALMWSRALRSLAPRLQDLGDDDEGFADEPDLGEYD